MLDSIDARYFRLLGIASTAIAIAWKPLSTCTHAAGDAGRRAGCTGTPRSRRPRSRVIGSGSGELRLRVLDHHADEADRARRARAQRAGRDAVDARAAACGRLRTRACACRTRARPWPTTCRRRSRARRARPRGSSGSRTRRSAAAAGRSAAPSTRTSTRSRPSRRGSPCGWSASSGFFTSGPLAKLWTTMSSGLSPKSALNLSATPWIVKSSWSL